MKITKATLITEIENHIQNNQLSDLPLANNSISYNHIKFFNKAKKLRLDQLIILRDYVCVCTHK